MKNPSFLLILLLFSTIKSLQAQVLTTSNLPIVSIKTGGQTIVDEPKITASMKIVELSAGLATLADTGFLPSVQIGIEKRGTSSQDTYPKVGYAVETRDSSGASTDITPFGFPKNDDWVLVGPYNDKSLMRDALAYAIASESMVYAPRASFIELVINNKYQGVYLFLEKIKRGKNRVDISKLKPTDITGDQLTGGYILKLDKPTGQVFDGWQSNFLPFPGATQRTFFQYHYPKPEGIVKEQKDYIQSFVYDFESNLNSNSYMDTVDGYVKYIDVDSWVDYLLVNEVSKNLDAYRLSTFMYKNRDSLDQKLHMGPVWDFNIAFGIGDYCDAGPYQGWAFDFNQQCPWDAWVIPFWWEKLMKDPLFKKKLADRWHFLRQNQWTNVKMLGKIDSMQTLLTQPQARNFTRWPVLGTYVWPNFFIGQTWSSEVGYLRTWLTNRLFWMDGKIDAMVSVDTSYGLLKLVKPSPNPARGSTFFEYLTPPGVDLTIELFDVSGHLLSYTERLPTGKNGRFELPLPEAAGVYFYRFKQNSKVVTTGKIVVIP